MMENWSQMIKNAVPDPEGKAWEEEKEEDRIIILWGELVCFGPFGLNQEVLWRTKSRAPTLSLVNKMRVTKGNV